MMLLCGLGWERRGNRKRKWKKKKEKERQRLSLSIAGRMSCIYHRSWSSPWPLRDPTLEYILCITLACCHHCLWGRCPSALSVPYRGRKAELALQHPDTHQEPNISASKWSQVILILLSVNQVLGYNYRTLFKSVLNALSLCALSTPTRASVRSLVTDAFVKHVTPDRTSLSFLSIPVLFMYLGCRGSDSRPCVWSTTGGRHSQAWYPSFTIERAQVLSRS